MLLALIRGAFVASVLSGFGTVLFLCALLPPAAPTLSSRCRAVARISLLLAGAAGFAWIVLEARVIAEVSGVAETAAAVPTVLLGTRFGQVLALQALALAGAAVAMASGARGGALAAIFAGLAALLEAGHSHAFAMSHGLSALLLSQAVHLLAAGAWLGGLLPLLIVVQESPLDIAALAARRFSTLGLFAAALLAATALFQGAVLSGSLKGLTETAYGAVLLIKATLFAALIGLAAVNRLRFTPALLGPQGEMNRRALALSIGLETTLGLCVVLAASVLSSLEPGMHFSGA
jgi:putative copper resistance protein D